MKLQEWEDQKVSCCTSNDVYAPFSFHFNNNAKLITMERGNRIPSCKEQSLPVSFILKDETRNIYHGSQLHFINENKPTCYSRNLSQFARQNIFYLFLFFIDK